MLEHNDYVFVLYILDQILKCPGDARRRQIRADVAQVVRVQDELSRIGFRLQEGKLVLPIEVPDVEIAVQRIRVQELADKSIDPENITLAQIAEVLERNGHLPGIDTSINDDPISEGPELGDESERPRKPWEN